MNSFTAKNGVQLDKCLRLLHSRGIPFEVKVTETVKGKIIFVVTIDVEETVYNDLLRQYQMLIA